MKDDFDPIQFLEIKNLTFEQTDKLRSALYGDMAKYLLEQFVNELSEEKFLAIESRITQIKTPEAVMEIIQKYDPQFEEKKLSYLFAYRNSFDLKKFADLL